MPRVRLFHWKAAEAAPLIAELKAVGFSVGYDEDFHAYWPTRAKSLPEVFVIDLTRQPAHGREVAIALRGYKATRQIPIVFVDGDSEKVETVRRILPDAIYTSRVRLPAAIRRAKPTPNPLVPAQMMDRYAGRTAAQKIGIGKDMRVAVVDPPPDYQKVVGELPEGAWLDEESSAECKITLWFAHDYAAFAAALPKMRRVAEQTRLWILWRKGKRDGLNDNLVRRGGNEVGLVDYKICSVNDTWTGMVFAIKKVNEPRNRAASNRPG
jgi:hypothetical protein